MKASYGDSSVLKRVAIAVLFACLITACRSTASSVVQNSGNVSRTDGPSLWSIGIAHGNDPLHLVERTHPSNPVLTWRSFRKPDAAFVADPFLVREQGTWHLFFELFNTTSGRGEIGVASSQDLSTWQFTEVVLAEPFHLSYPFVFKSGDSYFMMPESRASHSIRLYRATSFPQKWKLEKVLIEGNYSDPSPVFFQGRWWLFACKAPYALSLFYADSLYGPWHEHPMSPMYKDDPSKSRPGGRPVVSEGRLIRYVQNNTEGYGRKVRAMVVDTLTPTEFLEHPAERDPFFAPHGDHWARSGMHHVAPVRLDDGSWVASIDGRGDGK